ncbi:hypothetical protein HanPI659440_Chr11g0440581 [Helianthus annuus]|nr:hypothetical protein HanPI659440_Chr11g0440581 [Helianthus annuus]
MIEKVLKGCFVAGLYMHLWDWALFCVASLAHIAAEDIHGCCLCFREIWQYTILKIVLIQLKVALVGFIVLDHRWEKDLSEDPTESIDSIREFIEDNVEICKWVGITTLLPFFLSAFMIQLCFLNAFGSSLQVILSRLPI